MSYWKLDSTTKQGVEQITTDQFNLLKSRERKPKRFRKRIIPHSSGSGLVVDILFTPVGPFPFRVRAVYSSHLIPLHSCPTRLMPYVFWTKYCIDIDTANNELDLLIQNIRNEFK